MHIGTSVDPDPLATDATYSDLAAREFDSITTGNTLKWDWVEPVRGQFNWDAADQMVAFAKAHHQMVRGHTLAWHDQIPTWVTGGGFTATQLRGILHRHVTTEVSRFAGKVAAWDVVNEPLNEDGSLRNSVWLQNLGSRYIADALRWAREADATAKLYINDYNVEGLGAKSDALFYFVRSLQLQGVPIDGVGLEAHFVAGHVPTTLQANIQRFADLGLDVSITELDVRAKTPASSDVLATQGADYRSVIDACLAVMHCVSVTTWGFTDKYSWIPSAYSGYGQGLPFDENYQPKPAFGAIAGALTPSATAAAGASAPRATTKQVAATRPITVAEPLAAAAGTAIQAQPAAVAQPAAARSATMVRPVAATQPLGSRSDQLTACRVSYLVNSRWASGFSAAIEVTNLGTAPISGWDLRWTVPSGQQVVGGWNGRFSVQRSVASVLNTPLNEVIKPGSSATLGFIGGYSGPGAPTRAKPSLFTLNGAACQ